MNEQIPGAPLPPQHNEASNPQTTPSDIKRRTYFLLMLAAVICGGVIIVASVMTKASDIRSTVTKSSPSSYTRNTDIATTSVSQKVIDESWKTYQSDKYNYSLSHPADYTVQTGNSGSQLLEKVSFLSSSSPHPLITVLVWENTPTPLQKPDVENWCFRTLKDEARKEKMLCAFLSGVAIEDATLDNKIAYRVNYYNSDQEKVDFYIIPLETHIITVQAITLLDDKRYDNGISQAKQIVETLTFN